MNNKGFTLLELLATIIIVIALSTLIVPNIMKYMKQGEAEYNKNIEEMVKIAGTNYYADHKDKLEEPDPVISVKELASENYLSKDITDKKGNTCMKSSYAFAVKDENGKYTYKACIICDNNEDESIFENVITEDNCLK